MCIRDRSESEVNNCKKHLEGKSNFPKSLNDELRKKIALFCNVEIESVIESIDASTIYEVPVLMQNEKKDE